MLPQQHLVTEFQANQPEHESNDRAGNPVTSVCVTNEKYMALLLQIWSTFVTVLRCSKTKITDGSRLLASVRVLWDIISKIYWQLWHSFFKNALESSYNFNIIEITWRKMARSVWLKPVSLATWCLHTSTYNVKRWTSRAWWRKSNVLHGVLTRQLVCDVIPHEILTMCTTNALSVDSAWHCTIIYSQCVFMQFDHCASGSRFWRCNKSAAYGSTRQWLAEH